MNRQLRPTRSTPLVIVTGTHPESMAALTVGLQWDLPQAVVVRHHIDCEELSLTRTVSAGSGVIEEQVLDLSHPCMSCALREDILPAIERLAASHRWKTIVVHLPVSADARQLCRAVVDDRGLRKLVHVASVVTALRGDSVCDDLLGGSTLLEVGAELVPDDDRGQGEVLSGHVEYADAIACIGGCDQAALELLTAIARPDARIHANGNLPGAETLLPGAHDTDRSEAWTAIARRGRLPTLAGHRVWQLDLASERPLHPGRFMEEIEAIGSGRHRSRGCFWLASRPQDVCAWEGSGGHLNIGTVDEWQGRPFTRLVITGDWGSDDVNQLATRFQRCLLTDAEFTAWQVSPMTTEDGFEPWLGPIETASPVRHADPLHRAD